MAAPHPPLTISRKDILAEGSDDQFRRMVYALVQSVSRLSAFRDVFGRELDITPSQFTVLMGIAHCQGTAGVTVRDIADHVAMAATHVTTEVGRLKRKGLVSKRPSPSDGRSVLVALSPAGRASIERVMPLIRDINDILFEHLDPKSMKVIHDFAMRLISNAELAMGEVRRRRLEKASGMLSEAAAV
jgi:DNA-binding MarR family transcriptional regulator